MLVQDSGISIVLNKIYGNNVYLKPAATFPSTTKKPGIHATAWPLHRTSSPAKYNDRPGRWDGLQTRLASHHY
jgi:hypothetical protein